MSHRPLYGPLAKGSVTAKFNLFNLNEFSAVQLLLFFFPKCNILSLSLNHFQRRKQSRQLPAQVSM